MSKYGKFYPAASFPDCRVGVLWHTIQWMSFDPCQVNKVMLLGSNLQCSVAGNW